VERATFHDTVRRETAALAAAVGHAPDALVASCPGWTVTDLGAHLGMVQRWAAEIVRSATSEPIGWSAERWPSPPAPAMPDWLLEGGDALVQVLDSCDPDAPVWTFAGMRTNAFWSRRQAHEVSVHRWDGQMAASRAPSPIDSDLAADGIDEAATVFLPRRRGRSKVAGQGETLHLHRTDGPGEWLMTFTADGLTTTSEHAKGDAAVRASASSLLLWVWGRPVDDIEVFGDRQLLERLPGLLPAI
jgi:uncharacterized protein (TIGR03083 family)